MSSNDMLVQILKIVNDLKEDVKENRRELQKGREIEESHWQENLRRWEENRKLWEENNKRWEEYKENRKQDRKDILDILTKYDMSRSEQLGDPNVKKVRKII